MNQKRKFINLLTKCFGFILFMGTAATIISFTFFNPSSIMAMAIIIIICYLSCFIICLVTVFMILKDDKAKEKLIKEINGFSEIDFSRYLEDNKSNLDSPLFYDLWNYHKPKVYAKVGEDAINITVKNPQNGDIISSFSVEISSKNLYFFAKYKKEA